MELDQAMSTLRAVRRLRTDPIPDDVLHRILQAAAWAPTGGNTQPWRVIVVQDPAKKQGLAELYRPEWEQYVEATWRGRLESMPDQQRATTEKMLAAGDYLAAHLQDAPVILLFCFDPRWMAITDADLDRPSVIGGGSLYPAIQNLMLACVQEGLGCTLTTLHAFREAEVKALLGVPERWGTSALIPIGYPLLRGHGPITRQPVGQLAYRDEFGEPWTAAAEDATSRAQPR